MSIQTQHDDATQALLKVSLAWLGAALGRITLQDVVLALTGIYTAAQLFVLVRDKIWKGKQ